jgi:glycosyltransferase involved in cell wall biosynthesis
VTKHHHLGLIVCSYNMARELPRTLQSLARPFQRDIEALDYEVIVVDNGSTKPAKETELTQFGLNLRLLTCDAKSHSPARALNMGLAACQAQNIGVMIDGARMASPRLLAAADKALAMHPRAIVFTQSLQLGDAPQWLAAETGYNQSVEDSLLARIDWNHN